MRCGWSSTTASRSTYAPGDTVVQNGTRHAWRNHGDTTARVAVFLIGAHHAASRRAAVSRRIDGQLTLPYLMVADAPYLMVS